MGTCFGKRSAQPIVEEKTELVPKLPTLSIKKFGFCSDFKTRYLLKDEIGRGSFGRTYIAEGVSDGTADCRVAVKIIPKASLITEVAMMDVYREVEILRRLAGHDGIVTFIEAFEDEACVYIVMELCSGGELMDHILSRGKPYSESKATYLIWQVLTAVAYMHEKHVIHRDIKPENFLFADTKDSVLKAIDFGLSHICSPGDTLNEVVGSPFFVAPEVLQQVYDLKADEWSVGVLAYILLIGTRPFFGRSDSEIFKAVLWDEPDIDSANLSTYAKDFLKTLLKRDVKARSTAAEALQHPWITQKAPSEAPTPSLQRRCPA